ncbi:hypothetical protein D9758_002191 [Tetrapyrgos nigripes]|uniref:Uncharacterized protein n=1 Tax=Tetrapyrgos nigripes TaxID=182062 RepID=A0A8H5GP28_9AGAR|nr:hypothetical protein D9758_002191 [Tetrapyrgos nigripes]
MPLLSPVGRPTLVVLGRPDSFSTIATSSGSSYTDTDSTVTVTGLGASSGRIIKALGQLTRHQLDHIQLQFDKHRLHAIQELFPQNDESSPDGKDYDKAYDDVIEFAMPHLEDTYSTPMRREALRIILVQIAIRQTNQFLRRLFYRVLPRNHHIELYTLLKELVSCLPESWHPGVREQYNISKHYLNACNDSERHAVLPILDFLLQLAQISSIEGHILPIAVSASNPLHVLSKLHRHPLSQLRDDHDSTTRCVSLSLLTAEYSPTLRRGLWTVVSSHLQVKRYKQIEQVIAALPKEWDTTTLSDASMDILGFVCGTDSSTVRFGLSCTIQFLKSNFHPAWGIFAEALTIIPYPDQVHLFSSIALHLGSKNLSSRMRPWPSSSRPRHSRDTTASSDTTDAFIAFCTYSVHRYPSLKQPLIQSGFLPFYFSILLSHVYPPIHAEILNNVTPEEYYSIVEDVFDVLSTRREGNATGSAKYTYQLDLGRRGKSSADVIGIWKNVLEEFGVYPEAYDWRTYQPVDGSPGRKDDEREQEQVYHHPWLPYTRVKATLIPGSGDSDGNDKFHLHITDTDTKTKTKTKTHVAKGSRDTRYQYHYQKKVQEWYIEKRRKDVECLGQGIVSGRKDKGKGEGVDRDGLGNDDDDSIAPTSSGMMKIWKDYPRCQDWEKENLIQEFLHGLFKHPSSHSAELLEKFLTTDYIDKTPPAHTRSRSDIAATSSNAKAKSQTPRRALSQQDDFLETANRLGLL